jgi:hypothetical protein
MAAALLCGSAFAGDPKPGDVGYVDIAGTGTGRVYTLTYQARDAAGNVATQSVTVSVPLSRR